MMVKLGGKLSRTIRFPQDIHDKIELMVENDRTATFTDVVIKILDQYFKTERTGLCPSCHTQNLPDSQYCQKCGSSLNEEKSTSKINELEKRIEELQKRIESLESMRVEQIGSTLRIAIDKNKKSG